MPRDAGGSIEITEGTGPIRAMVSTGELLEIYKSDKTFRLETPETIDPARTNPNAPFVVTRVHDVGTSNRIVARVLLQADQILTSALVADQEKVNSVRKQLHACKEHLLRCEAVANHLRVKMDKVQERVNQLQSGNARLINPLPQVDGLEADCGTFLADVNRAVRMVSGLPSLFVPLEKPDNNFDHLQDRLVKEIGENEAVTQLVTAAAPDLRRLVDLRNYFEHPAQRKTVVRNFHVLPEGSVSQPTWNLSGDTPVSILKDMSDATDLLVCVTEELLINLVLYRGRDRFLFNVQETPDDQLDRDFPVKYRVLVFLKPGASGSRPSSGR